MFVPPPPSPPADRTSADTHLLRSTPTQHVSHGVVLPQTIVPAALPVTTSTTPFPPSSSYPSHAHTSSSGHAYSHSYSSNNLVAPNPHSTTRILLFANFHPDLKTRDIQLIFGEWEEDRGGFKIKWVDDVSCWVVFADPGTAKRAYLNLIAFPPPALRPSEGHVPKLSAYAGDDAISIIGSVQNRPRSRSTGGAGHSRKGSALGSGSGVLVGGMNGGGGGHGRTGSFNGAASNVGGVSGHRQLRSSLGQMQWKDTMEGGAGPHAARGQDSASPPLINTGGSPLMARNGSGGSMKAGEGGMGRNSPVGMTGHRKSESRTSPIETVTGSLTSLTIDE